MYDLNAFQKALQYMYKYGVAILDAAVIIVFLIFLIQTLRNKDLKLSFVSKLLGEVKVVKVYQQVQNPTSQQPNPGSTCPNCGKANQANALFCTGCGTSLK